jgi:plastocyanin
MDDISVDYVPEVAMQRVYVGLVSAGLVLAGCSSSDGGPPTGNDPNGTIAGQVIDADSGNSGVPGITVQLVGPAGTQNITTGAGGAFSVGSAAPGSWSATLQLPATYRLAATETGTRTSTVTAGQTSTLTQFRMARPKGSVTGTAVEGTAGIAGGTVAATRGGFTTRNATPTVAGYTIADLATGPWTLAYTPPTSHRVVAGQSNTRFVTIAEGTSVTASAFVLEPAPPAPQIVEIHLNGTSFLNGTITIAAGTTVRWINDDGQAHTVTPENSSQAGVWARQTTSSTGVVFEHTFTVANQTYRYRCEPHSADFTSGMVGVITVS